MRGGPPFADWKLFVRGLAAHSRREFVEARANWDRLDPDRAAARIARGLQVLGGTAPETADGGEKGAVKFDALERRIFGAAVLEPIEQLRALLAQGRLNDAVRRIGSLRQLLANIDPALSVRLTRVLYDPVIQAARERDYREAKALVKEFTYAAERLPIDPRWNRLWALIWEGPQGELKEAEDHWNQYCIDLQTVAVLNPDERVLAQALVLNRLGEQHLDEIGPGFGPAAMLGPDSLDEEEEADEEREHAIALFEKSLDLAPDHRPTYGCLMKAYQDWGRPDDAASVARRLLDRFPDDFDALMFLASYHFRRQEPEPALECARRARALKPLDESALQEEWSIHIMRARHLALKARWDEGRAEFAEAERLKPETSRWLHSRARRAVFELKAGQAEAARELIGDALADLPEATSFWLALLIESIRYKLPWQEQHLFETRWKAALPKKARSDTAGAMAELMGSFVAGDFNYTGRAGTSRMSSATWAAPLGSSTPRRTWSTFALS